MSVVTRAHLPILGVALCWGLFAGCEGDGVGVENLPAGPVVIHTSIDFSTPPFGGTFVVEQGAHLFGCGGGSFVNGAAPLGPAEMMATRFVCDRGPEEGTFTATFRPTARLGASGLRGRWTIVDGTGTFSGLLAEGAFTLRFTGPGTGRGSMRIGS